MSDSKTEIAPREHKINPTQRLELSPPIRLEQETETVRRHEDDSLTERLKAEAAGDPDLASPLRYLGFISPGTWLTIKGKPHYGASINLALCLLFIAGPAFCSLTNLFPVPILAASLALVILFWGYSVWHVFNHPPRYLSRFETCAQTGLAFLTFWIPFVLCFLLNSGAVLQRTWMGNETMMPEILKGDIVLVDRLAFRRKDPTYGDLVLVEDVYTSHGQKKTRAFFGRIIACPGDLVQLYGVHPSVNNKSLKHYIRREDNDVFKKSITVYELPFGTDDSLLPVEEPKRWYPVISPNQLLSSPTNQVTLDPQLYYVLEDNRDYARTHVKTSYGSIVHRKEIQGRPRYVIYNTEIEKPFNRYGLALQ